MTTGLIWLIIIGLIAIAAIVVRRADCGPPVTQPSCAKCHYAVALLPTRICPECGSDLQTVGVLVPGRAGRFSLFGSIIIMTVLMLVSFVVMTNVLGELLPQHMCWTRMVDLYPPNQSSKRMFFVSGTLCKWMGRNAIHPNLPKGFPGRFVIGIAPYAPGAIQYVYTSQGLTAKTSLGGPTHHLVIDTQSQYCHEVDANGATTSSNIPFTASAITAWLQRASPTDDPATLTAQAESLVKVIEMNCDDNQVESFLRNSAAPAFVISGSGSSSGNSSDTWMLLIGAIVTACVWLAIVYRLALAHRRRQVVRISEMTIS